LGRGPLPARRLQRLPLTAGLAVAIGARGRGQQQRMNCGTAAAVANVRRCRRPGLLGLLGRALAAQLLRATDL
jgi:hypothetical protein